MTGPRTVPVPQVATLDSNRNYTFVILMENNNSGFADIFASVTTTSNSGETLHRAEHRGVDEVERRRVA